MCLNKQNVIKYFLFIVNKAVKTKLSFYIICHNFKQNIYLQIDYIQLFLENLISLFLKHLTLSDAHFI